MHQISAGYNLSVLNHILRSPRFAAVFSVLVAAVREAQSAKRTIMLEKMKRPLGAIFANIC